MLPNPKCTMIDVDDAVQWMNADCLTNRSKQGGWSSRFHRETFHCFKHRFHFSYLYVISLPLSAAQWRPTTAQAWVAHRQAVPHIFCTASLWPHSSLHQTGSPSSACRLQISLQDHKSTFLLSLPICQSRAVFHRRLTPLLLWPLLSYMMCQTMGTLQQMHLVLKWKKCQWEINLRRRCTCSVNPQSTRKYSSVICVTCVPTLWQKAVLWFWQPGWDAFSWHKAALYTRPDILCCAQQRSMVPRYLTRGQQKPNYQKRSWLGNYWGPRWW